MKDKLIEILQLPATATEADIITAATVLSKKAHSGITGDNHEKQIQEIMKSGGGAITREVAQEILNSSKK